MRRLPWILAVVSMALVGCRVDPPFNPNDPNQVSADRQPLVIKAYMKQMSEDVIGPAVLARQITKDQGDQMMVDGAKDYLKTVHLKRTPPDAQWMLGEAFITAHEWARAEEFLTVAMQADSGPDRQVHDRVWLARCQAELGKVDEAIATARSSFVAPPEWKWPILYAVIYEIVPPAVRIKPEKRIELAHLVEDAIKQHEAAVGSLEDDRTSQYVATRNFHIAKAWQLVVELYTDAKRPDLAHAAAVRATDRSHKAESKSTKT